MIELLKTELLTFNFEADESILSFLWTEKTAEMEDDDFKSSLESYLRFVQKHRPRRLLIDIRKFRHQMTPELGAWRDENISPGYSEAGVRRLTFVVPEGFPSPPAEERPPEGLAFLTGFFATEEAARAWLRAG